MERLSLPRKSISNLVIRGGCWLFGLRVTDRLIGLTRNLVLARLLSPNDFGLFGIALLSLSVIETLSQPGFQQALIQKKGNIKPYLDTAWTVQVIRGIALAIILFLAAPYIAQFFNTPLAIPILQALSLVPIFYGFTNIKIVYFQKELEFHKHFIYMISGSLVELGVGVASALLLKNAWALVYGLLTGSLVRMIISYVIDPYQPIFRIQTKKIKDLYSFGLWIWGIGIIGFVALHADKAIIGKLLGLEALGLYVLAYSIANIVVMDIGRVASSVMFPAFSKIQDERQRLGRGFVNSIEIVLFFSLPLTIFIIILAPKAINVLLGERWMPMVGALQLLAISGFFRCLIMQFAILSRAVGRPTVEFWLTLIRVMIVVSLSIPFSQIWGISGIAGANILGIGVTAPLWWFFFLKKIIEVSMSQILEKLFPLFAAGILMVIGMVLLNFLIDDTIWIIINEAIVGMVIYILTLVTIWVYLGKGPIGQIMNLLAPYIKK